MYQLRDWCARALPILRVPHAEVEGHPDEEAEITPLAQVLLGELTELELELFWRVNAFLH